MKLTRHHTIPSALLLATQLLLVVLTIPHFHLASSQRSELRARSHDDHGMTHTTSVCPVCVLRSDAQADAIDAECHDGMLVSVGSTVPCVREEILRADTRSAFLRGPPSV